VIAQNIVTALLGIVAFVVFIQNFFLVKLRFFERILALVTALVFIHGSWITDTIGIVLLAFMIAIQYIRKKKADNNQQLATS
jgi:TRAP-type uncharacterized transport system fused permease subunit